MIVAARLLRDRRTATLWWAAGFVSLTLFTVAFYPSIKDQRAIEDLLAGMPETFRTMVGYQPDVPLSSPAGYLHARLFSTIAPVLAIVYGIGAGARAIAGSEEVGTLEPLLANPITRSRILVERYLATFALLLALTAVFTLALLVLAQPFDALDGISIANLLGACAAAFTLGLLHGTLAFTVGAAAGRRGLAIAVATSVAVAGYLIQNLLGLSDNLRPWRVLSPWHWYLDQNMLAEGPTPAAILLPVAISAALLSLGWIQFLRRDLR
jgi:ABC-2 type transport system permease protein